MTRLTAALLLSLASLNAAAGGDEGKALVDGFVNDIDTFRADFEQSLLDADGELLEVSSGTLSIDRPGRFRWHYLKPYEQILVADGLNVWSYDVDLEQVTVKPQAETLESTPAQLLGGSAHALEQFVYEGSVEDGGLAWVRLRPKDTDSGFRRLDLAFRGDRLERMVFLDNLDQTTTIVLSGVEVNVAIDPARFAFTPPQGVDVVGTPLSAEPRPR